ncbi:hypothetical protein RI367_000655 [Sorochytrium milnesiophthora]
MEPSLTATTVATAALCILVPYVAYKVYKATVVPRELAHLPRVPITSTLKALFTPNGFIAENQVLAKGATEWCLAHGKDKDAWRDMYLIWLFGKWGVVLGKPEYLRTFFTNTETFPKYLPADVGFDLNARFLGINVIISNGDIWRQHRKMANPAFHRSWTTHVFGHCGRVLLQQLDDRVGQPVDSFDWMQRATLDILSSAAFGKSLDAIRHPHSRIVKLYNTIMHDLQIPWFQLFPVLQRSTMLPQVRQLHRQIDEFDAFIYGIIDDKEREAKLRLEAGEVKDAAEMDLLDRMIEASWNDASFTKTDLRSQVVIFFVAGHDTTAAALSSTLYFLGVNKAIQDTARVEVLRVLGEADAEVPPDQHPYATTLEQSEMTYLTCVLKETLRLMPAVTGLPLRRTSKAVTLGSAHLPADTPVHVDIFGVQRNADVWGPDAHEYIPDRWLRGPGGVPQGSPSKPGSPKRGESEVELLAEAAVPMSPSSHGYAWIPFGGGQRLCMGQQFSVIEQRVLLAMLLQRYEWKVVGDSDAVSGRPKTASGVLLHPTKVQIQFTKRI